MKETKRAVFRLWLWLLAGLFAFFTDVWYLWVVRNTNAEAALTALIGDVLKTDVLSGVLPWLYPPLFFMVGVFLWWWASRKMSVVFAASLCTLIICSTAGLSNWPMRLAAAGGIVAGIGITVLCRFCWHRFPKVFNRETVSYVVFGGLTTVVNIVSYLVTSGLLPLSNEVLRVAVANVVAWIVSVAFAYVVNKLFVFQSRTHGAKALLWEAAKFVGARLFSFGVDEVGMILLEGVLKMPSFWAKVITNVAVMVMNYFFSKWFIFKGQKSTDQ